jgi:hypothetical protein
MQARERVVAFCLLSVEGLVGAFVFLRAAAGDYSWTTGSDTQFTFWLTEAWLYAGPVMVVASLACGAFLLLPLGRAAARVVVVMVLAVATSAFGVAAVTVHQRGHPEALEVAALRRLVPPTGAVEDRTSYGSRAPDFALMPKDFAAELVATPLSEDNGPPTAVRSWRVPTRTDACAETGAVTQAWADPGSVDMKAAPSDGVPGIPCEWFATYRGWQVLVEVVDFPNDPRLGNYAVFQVGTPNVQF